MSTTTETTITENELHNLQVLKNLFEYGQCFTGYAKSVNNLFYYYIQNCIHKSDEIFLDQNDVYNLKEIVNALQDLK